MALQNKKHLGQHWLKNPVYLEEIAERTYLEDYNCLEIGPGLGTLTSRLLKKFNAVTAVEFDQKLADNLPKSFPGKDLTVINADILSYPEDELAKLGKYVLAGNIPYYITSPIIRKFLTAINRPEKIVLLIQKEVAERIAAEPGDHSLLSLFVQNLAEVELGSVVPASEFTPPPKVDSQIIEIIPREEMIVTSEAMKLANIGFSNPRKKLASNLANVSHDKEYWREKLASIGANPDCRAEDLELLDWQELL